MVKVSRAAVDGTAIRAAAARADLGTVKAVGVAKALAARNERYGAIA